jgi:Holliday junction resolvase RusA-like endonuclease
MGKGRPKFARRGNFVSTYTPEKTANYETLVKWYFQQEAQGQKLDGMLKVEIDAFYPIPKSTSKKQAENMRNGIIRPVKKPDFDNVGKIICDSLNEIAFKDDSQIVDGRVQKFYSDTPRVEIEIGEFLGGAK